MTIYNADAVKLDMRKHKTDEYGLKQNAFFLSLTGMVLSQNGKYWKFFIKPIVWHFSDV